VTDVDSAAAERHPGKNRGEQFLRCHLPMVIVTVVIVLAVIFVASDRWRRGALFFGGATLLAAAFRLCLPTARVGLLAVRSKPFDVATLSILGTAIVFIAATINTLGIG
jgi:cation transport ATPase